MNNKHLTLLLISALVVLSCSDAMQDTISEVRLNNPILTLNATNAVSYDNIVAVSQTHAEDVKAAATDKPVIHCITGENKDTLLYVCDKADGGWIVYASDRRVPPIVAESGKGSYAELSENEHAMIWLQTMAEDMQVIRSLDDEALKFTTEEIEENKKFWRSVTDPDGFVKELLVANGSKDGLPHGPTIPQGHYILVNTEYSQEVYDSIGRLTITNWDQNYPYNKYCPYISTSNTGNHAPAGCVAIAGAQMLYFLHYKWGVPFTAPSEAYCYSNITDNPYIWGQTTPSSTIWDYMNKNYEPANDNSAPLIANVGYLVGMDYGEDGSGATTADLVDDVFHEYGIGCEYTNFNTSDLSSSLLGGIPVILRAKSQHEGEQGVEKSGHAFIADRYKRTRTKITRTYEWVYDSPPNNVLLPVIPRKVEYTYTSPTISQIGINWGWGGSIISDSQWYSVMGDWIDYSLHYNWNISRYMIHNFHVLNDN